MDLQYSTLEHIRHDETAGALQRDHNTMVFEIDTDASAPQVNSSYHMTGTLTDRESRLYQMKHHKCFTKAYFLRSRTTKILRKNALLNFLQPYQRANGYGQLWRYLLSLPSSLESQLGSGVTASIRYQGREFVLSYFCSVLTS